LQLPSDGSGDGILELEHIGSTAVPGLRSKPIIDMMAAVRDLRQGLDLAQLLSALGYELIETGMRNRLFLRRRSESQGQAYQLHIVELSTWEQRKERLMRDYLLAHPDAATAYGELKKRLAEEHTENSLAYTRAKTAFIPGPHRQGSRGARTAFDRRVGGMTAPRLRSASSLRSLKLR